MAANSPLSTLGKIVEGEEAGRLVEVLDDRNNSGGYLICTYADDQRSHEPFDSWVATYGEVNAFFFASNCIGAAAAGGSSLPLRLPRTDSSLCAGLPAGVAA